MQKVSIIIPSYNQAQYIAEAINGAIKQDYHELEIIVADDISSDNTKDVVKEFLNDKRIKFFVNNKNLGRTGNYKWALNNYASGDYVLFNDCDDYLIDYSYISKCMKLIEQGSDMVFSNNKTFIEDKNLFIENKVNDDLPLTFEGNYLFINYFKYYIPHLTCLYNRKKAIELDFYRENIISSDWESLLRYIPGKKISYIKSYIGVWRKHSSNASKSFNFNEIIQNTKFVDNPFNYVQSLNLFSEEELLLWRKKMLHRFFSSYLIRLILGKQPQTKIIELRELIKKYDEEIYEYINEDIRFTLLKIFVNNKHLTRWVFKHILKQEAFFIENYKE